MKRLILAVLLPLMIAARDADSARQRMEQHLDRGSQLMKEALMRGQIAGVGVG